MKRKIVKDKTDWYVIQKKVFWFLWIRLLIHIACKRTLEEAKEELLIIKAQELKEEETVYEE